MDIPFKNKADKGFRQFRAKIFLRTIAMLVIAAVIIYITYSFLLRGNFENLIISVFQNIFGMDYDAALDLYQRTFRSYMDTILLLSMLFVFIALFHVYLRWFTRYFEEVNRELFSIQWRRTSK